MNEEKSPVVAYTIMRYEDGSVNVVDAGGTTPVTDEQIYKDIEDVAELIKMKRTENAVFAAVTRYFRMLQQQEESASTTEPKIQD